MTAERSQLDRIREMPRDSHLDAHQHLMEDRYESTPAGSPREWNLLKSDNDPIAQAGTHVTDLSYVGNMIRDDVRYLAQASHEPIVERALYDLVKYQETLMKSLHALGMELTDVALHMTEREQSDG